MKGSGGRITGDVVIDDGGEALWVDGADEGHVLRGFKNTPWRELYHTHTWPWPVCK